ncbi:MAG: sigma-70 family RNA polymerase sigma factor [Chloroflexota bacterium]
MDKDVTILSDNRLLENIALGDTASFDQLFHHHYDRVYGLLYRLVGTRTEAEDITQEVFVKLYKHAFEKRFMSQREHNIGAWLYRTAMNSGYNALRSNQRREKRDAHLVPDPKGSPGVDRTVEQRERETAVRQALSKINQRDAQLLLMRQMGFSYAECAEAVNVASSSVGTLIKRAAEAFKAVYEGDQNV